MQDGCKHGGIIPITQKEYDALIEAYGVKPTNAATVTESQKPVASYDFEHYEESVGIVDSISIKEVSDGLNVILENGEIIQTTSNHPFWSATSGCWKSADSLQNSESIYCQNGTLTKVSNIEINNQIHRVYNFSVSDNHNYYVGNSKLLVHNECSTLQGKRNKAVNDAWKNYRDNMDTYNPLNLKASDFNKYGRVSGYQGAHIKDVNALIGTKSEYLISDWRNIVLMSKESHLAVHSGCWANATNPNRIIELCPWAAQQVQKIISLVA